VVGALEVDELRERGAVVLGVGIGARDAWEWDCGGAFIVCMLGAVAVRRRGPVMAVDFEFGLAVICLGGS
jgi:hypothetical protein